MLSVYAQIIGIFNFIKQTLLGIKTQTDLSTVIVGHFSAPFKAIGHSNKNTTMSELNDIMDQMDLIDYRTFAQAL